jgi:hypothetical protein
MDMARVPSSGASTTKRHEDEAIVFRHKLDMVRGVIASVIVAKCIDSWADACFALLLLLELAHLRLAESMMAGCFARMQMTPADECRKRGQMPCR